MAHSDFWGDLKNEPPTSSRIVANSGGEDKVVVGHSLWKASEVDSDQTLPVCISKHDTLDTCSLLKSWLVSASPWGS